MIARYLASISDNITKNKKAFLVGLFFLGLLVSFPSILKPMDSADIDAYWRANLGYNHLKNGQLFNVSGKVGAPWVPLHEMIMGYSILLLKHPQTSPRLISLVINAFSIPLLYLFSNQLFSKQKSKEKISVLSALIYIVHPFRLMIATQPLSETISITLLLAILLLLIKDKTNFLLIVILMNIATGIRYEFWYFLPLLFLLLYINNRNKLDKVVITTLASVIFPCYWMLINFELTGNPLTFFRAKHFIAKLFTPEVPYYNITSSIISWSKKLIHLTGPIGMLFVLITYKKYFQTLDIKKISILLIPIYFFLFLILQVYFGTMEILATRYLFSVFIPIIPFLSYGLISIWEKTMDKKETRYRYLFKTIFLVLVLFNIIFVMNNISNWRKVGSNSDHFYTNELIRHIKQRNWDTSKMTIVSKGEWMIPSIIYQSGNEDVKVLTPKEYEEQNHPYSQFTILSTRYNPDLECKGTKYFENNLYKVCSY